MPNVAEIIRNHVTLELDCMDRLYLNAYVPRLQSEGGVVGFLLQARGQKIPSPALFGQITEGFQSRLRAWCTPPGIPWIEFRTGECKDDVVQKHRDRFPRTQQERAQTWSATKQVRGRRIHFAYRPKSVCVNHYYFYLLDPQSSPAFLKVCGYAPYPIKLCLNGHEWAKCQLRRWRIPFTALDNGFLRCADPDAL